MTWLLDSPEPTGAAVMTMRRVQVLRGHIDSTVLTLSGGRVPQGAPLHGLPRLGSLTGELRIARSDLVVTTSERTLATAAPRLAPGTRLVHFLHQRPEAVFADDWFMRTMPRTTHVVVPVDVDPSWFAGRVGLSPACVSAADDFTVEADTLLGTGRPRVILAAGRLTATSGVLELAEAFRLARLDGWQLRIAGSGPARAELADLAARHGLDDRIVLLGARHDLAEQHVDTGFAVRLATADASGLPVHEALAAGVPVLGSGEVPAVRRLVRHGENGWVLDRVDPTAIADGLLALSDDDRRASFAAAARRDRSGLLTEQAGRELRDLMASIADQDGARL